MKNTIANQTALDTIKNTTAKKKSVPKPKASADELSDFEYSKNLAELMA